MCRACTEDRQYLPQVKCQDCGGILCPYDNRHSVLVDGPDVLTVCDKCLPAYVGDGDNDHRECNNACGPLADYDATFGGSRR